MLKRQGTHRTDEIAIVDVAMATLGPVALLMMVFMVLAAKTMASSVACDIPTEQEVAAAANALKGWMGEYAKETADHKSKLRATCPAIVPVEPPAVSADLSVSPLKPFCAANQNEIISRAGLSRSDVEHVLTERAGVDNAVRQCFGNPQNAQCRKPDASQSKAMAAEVTALRTQVRQQTEQLAHAARNLCGELPTLRPADLKQIILPESLRRLCHSEVEQVMTDAGTTVEQVGRELAMRDAMQAALLTCWTRTPGLESCRPIAADARSGEIDRLSRWAEQTRSGNAARIAHIQRDCPQPIPAPEAAGLPGFLQAICPGDLAILLSQSRLTWSEVAQLEAQSRRTLELVEQCTAPQSEKVSDRYFRFEFESCNDRLANGIDPVPLFADEAAEIAKAFRSGVYNRIDIFGHTDRNAVIGQCRNGAKNNIELSWTRAHYYREVLTWTFRNDPQYRDIVERLDRKELKMYEIGVGEAEPIDQAPTAAADRLNRRIEIRFVADRSAPWAP